MEGVIRISFLTSFLQPRSCWLLFPPSAADNQTPPLPESSDTLPNNITIKLKYQHRYSLHSLRVITSTAAMQPSTEEAAPQPPQEDVERAIEAASQQLNEVRTLHSSKRRNQGLTFLHLESERPFSTAII